MDKFPPARQRPILLDLVEKMKISARQLQRDECGDWRVEGRYGFVYADLAGLRFVIEGWATKGWNKAKSAMAAFATIAQDGEDEGILLLARAPTEGECDAIRKWVGLKRRREMTEQQLADLRERASRNFKA